MLLESPLSSLYMGIFMHSHLPYRFSDVCVWVGGLCSDSVHAATGTFIVVPGRCLQSSTHIIIRSKGRDA